MTDFVEAVTSLLSKIDKQKGQLGKNLIKLKVLQKQCSHPNWALVNEEYYEGGWDYKASTVRTYECTLCKSLKMEES